MSNCIIEAKNLSVVMDGNKILKDINIRITQKDYLVLFGADDAGKTTLLSVLMGFLRHYEGTAEVYGMPIDKLPMSTRKQIRLVPDDIVSERKMTAGEYFGLMGGLAEKYDSELEQNLCNRFEIDRNEQLLDMTYQGNKLTAIAAAICARPELLILDEPYNFLDKAAMNEVLIQLEQLNKEGTCVIITAEKYEHMRGYGNRYVYLSEGVIKGEGEITESFYRMKAVTVPKAYVGGELCDFDEVIGTRRDTVTYRYSGDMQKLLSMLQKTGCEDCMIEDISLEEELENDFSRWK